MTDPRAHAVRKLRRASGSLSTAAMGRMETDLPWFAQLGAEERSWVGLIVQGGVRSFVDWYSEGGTSVPLGTEMASSVFGAAPRALAGVISLHQTVDLIRLTIEVVEHNLDTILEPEVVPDVHDAVLRYAREIAFATAEVYARAAEVRGAWDARLEALVVDAVLRAETDDTVLSRASAVGWSARGEVAVVVGTVPPDQSEAGVIDAVRRAARGVGLDSLCAVQGHRLVVILGGATDPEKSASAVADHFDEGPVVVGPAADGLAHAHLSARAALAGLRVAAGWPEAPRPVAADELMPERILAGDDLARRHAVDQVFRPLAAREVLLETLSAFLESGGGIEATARALFVHPNTVRYRLGQVGDLTGLTPTRPRDALALRMALVLGRVPEDGSPADL